MVWVRLARLPEPNVLQEADAGVIACDVLLGSVYETVSDTVAPIPTLSQ